MNRYAIHTDSDVVLREEFQTVGRVKASPPSGKTPTQKFPSLKEAKAEYAKLQ